MKKIQDILVDESNLEFVARIEKVIVSTGSNGNNYMIVHLADKTGRVEARKWTVTDTDKEIIKPNAFIHIAGATSSEYRGVLQLKINDYEIITKDDLVKYGSSVDDFFISAPINIEHAYTDLMKILNGLTNPVYKAIALGLISKREKDFKTYPAAISIHHNVTGGLFWHSYTLVKNAIALKPLYEYASIDWDLVICGAVLHDYGKMVELIDESGVDYSLEGKLLGHISIGNAEINKMANELGIYLIDGQINPEVTLLQHMVLSSHGKYEFGSPMLPTTLEAIIISTLDTLDARIFRVNEEINKVDLDSWSPRIMSEDGRMFLHHFDKIKK